MCDRRTYWRPRQPRSSHWRPLGLRRGRCATSTWAGRLHSVCTKCFFPPRCTFDVVFEHDKTWFGVHSTIRVFCVSSEFPSSLHPLYITNKQIYVRRQSAAGASTRPQHLSVVRWLRRSCAFNIHRGDSIVTILQSSEYR